MLALGLTAAYQFFFYAPRVERFILATVAANSKARLKFKLERASLLFGFHFKDVDLAAEDGSPIFRAPDVRIAIALPSLFVGHIGIREFAVIQPEVFLTQVDGRWNYEALLPPAGPAAPEEPKSNAPPLKSISTYLPVKLYANIQIKNLNLLYSTTNRGVTQTASVKNFSLTLATITRTFREIPLDLGALDLFDTLIFSLNPDGPLEINVAGNPTLQGPLVLSWFLYRESGAAQTEFASRMALDTSKLVGGRAGGITLPLGIHLQYNMAYDAAKDIVRIRNVDIGQYGVSWIRMQAEVHHASLPGRSLDLRITQSRMDLAALGRMMSTVFPSPLGLDGELVLAPLSIKGDLARLSVSGDIKASRLVYRTATQSHALTDFRLKLDGSMDMYAMLPFLERPPGYKEETLAFGVLHDLRIPDMFAIYNGSTLRAKVDITPGKGILADMDLTNLVIDQFTGPGFTGVLGAQIHTQSSENFQVMNMTADMSIRNMRYAMKRSRSAPVHMTMKTDSLITLAKGVTEINTRSSHIELNTLAGENALSTDITGIMAFGGFQRYDLNFATFRMNYERLHPTLPGDLQYTMAGYRPYLSQGFEMTGPMKYSLAGDQQEIRSVLKLRLPFMGIEDLVLTMDMDLNKSSMVFHRVLINALRGTLTGSVTGKMVRKGDAWDPDMDVKLAMAQKDMLRVHSSMSMQGVMDLNLAVRPDVVNGRIFMKDVNMELTSGDCTKKPSPACKSTRIEQMNLDLPIQHDMHLKDPLRITEQPIDEFADAVGKANLTIRFIAASHNPRGEFDPDAYFYVGALPGNIPPGLAARLLYRKNVFHITWIKMTSYKIQKNEKGAISIARDSTIDGHNIYFNVADLDTRKMEYAMRLQIKNMDLEPYIPGAKKGFDGIISADLDVTGRDLTDPVYNTNARLAVHRISPEFSGFAVRILTPEFVAGRV
ncbi:MAG: hypothetical protein HY042_04970, partial [Spirochaetia bacterium]|nr:hypothetical protein [Spirochaetia bacterium]